MIPWILCIIFLLFIFLLCGKLFTLHRSLGELCAEFRERMQEDTNHLIYLSSADTYVRKLAAQMNEELRELRKQRLKYLQGDRELKEAITNISHDLRTPLTAIYGYLELLEGEEVSEEVGQSLKQIRNRTDALKGFTEELFQYSVIVTEEEKEKNEVVLNQVLEEALLGCYGAFVSRKIEPEIQIPEEKIRRILEETALRRVLDNIIYNALKYSNGDFKVTLNQAGIFTFSNISEELTPVMLERLFDRFYTVKTGKNTTGLGLSIAKTLTERIGGRLYAEYEEGRLKIVLEI
ncbi:MAG: sensor histidine kinase [Blautia sp.]